MKKKGFTLVELSVVLMILAMLAALIFPSFTWYKTRAEMQSMLSMAASASKAYAIYYAENGNLDGLSINPSGGEISASQGSLGITFPDNKGFTFDINVVASQNGSDGILVVTTLDPPGPPMGCVSGAVIRPTGVSRILQWTDPNNQFRLNSSIQDQNDIANEFGFTPSF